MRRNEDIIPVVVRDERQPFGLRAHPKMTFGRTTCTIFKYEQSEFVLIWLFILFAAYEWLQCIFILAQFKKFYDLSTSTDYFLIFLATFGIAASATATAIYLIYYPIPGKDDKERIKRQL